MEFLYIKVGRAILTRSNIFAGHLRLERPHRRLSRPAHTYRNAEGLFGAAGEDPEGAAAVRRRL